MSKEYEMLQSIVSLKKYLKESEERIEKKRWDMVLDFTEEEKIYMFDFDKDFISKDVSKFREIASSSSAVRVIIESLENIINQYYK